MNLINTRLTTPTTLTAGNAIPVGAVIHKYGNIYAGGSTFRIRSNGYYKITVNVSVNPTLATALTLSLNDGCETIATATAIPTAAGDTINLTLVAIVYRKCCCANDIITVTTSAGATVNEADFVIEKL